ncbi:hypothetical protein B0H34DRAFT_328364 [Crassisporium funariophilum]|nr:hypothetical protein B0H34DRAFT_328364 [Crassisporium funariophilum]
MMSNHSETIWHRSSRTRLIQSTQEHNRQRPDPLTVCQHTPPVFSFDNLLSSNLPRRLHTCSSKRRSSFSNSRVLPGLYIVPYNMHRGELLCLDFVLYRQQSCNVSTVYTQRISFLHIPLFYDASNPFRTHDESRFGVKIPIKSPSELGYIEHSKDNGSLNNSRRNFYQTFSACRPLLPALTPRLVGCVCSTIRDFRQFRCCTEAKISRSTNNEIGDIVNILLPWPSAATIASTAE